MYGCEENWCNRQKLLRNNHSNTSIELAVTPLCFAGLQLYCKGNGYTSIIVWYMDYNRLWWMLCHLIFTIEELHCHLPVVSCVCYFTYGKCRWNSSNSYFYWILQYVLLSFSSTNESNCNLLIQIFSLFLLEKKCWILKMDVLFLSKGVSCRSYTNRIGVLLVTHQVQVCHISL